MEEEAVRIRVVVDDISVLSRSQRLEGLRRSWLLLKPEMATIADVARQLKKRFRLGRSCPHGLLLSMDDFVLPSFESTCLLKDKDIIRVRKKGTCLVDAIDSGDQHHIKELCFAERQPTYSTRELLAITEFQEDSSGRHSKDEDDSCQHNESPIHTSARKSEKANSKRKRKISDKTSGSKGKKRKLSSSKIPSASAEVNEYFYSERKGGSSRGDEHSNGDDRSNILASQLEDTVKEMRSHEQKKEKRKKSKVTRPKKSIVATEDTDDISREQNYSSFVMAESSQKSLREERMKSNADDRSGVPIDSVLDGMTEERTDKPDENSAREPHVTGSLTKVPSRNARRKKAKRRWLRETRSQDNKDIQSEKPPNDIHEGPTEHEGRVLHSEMQEEVIPVVIRPGHIRFEPLDEEQSPYQSQGSMEILQWNGITSKKKGQKWGRENTNGKWNDCNGYKEQSHRKSIAEGYNNNEKSITEGRKSNEKSISGGWNSNGKSNAEDRKNNEACVAEEVNDKVNSIVEEAKTSDGGIDFESLLPLNRVPQDGDLLVYRLVELSSSWCPELSPFRVGKVLSYDPISMIIILVPVLKYPIFSNENTEEDEGEELMDQANVSAYNEDGSLEVHYSSLVDVRLLEASTAEYGGGEMNISEQALTNKNAEVMDTSAAALAIVSGPDSWEQIKQAISEKKAQLQKKNDADEGKTPSKTTAGTWSYRAMRGSALGPTLALLRGKDGLESASRD